MLEQEQPGAEYPKTSIVVIDSREFNALRLNGSAKYQPDINDLVKCLSTDGFGDQFTLSYDDLRQAYEGSEESLVEGLKTRKPQSKVNLRVGRITSFTRAGREFIGALVDNFCIVYDHPAAS